MWIGERPSFPAFSLPLIVLTGGPCAGKSSVLAKLRADCPAIEVIDETATLLLQGGFPTAGACGLSLDEWQQYFQASVFRVQQQREWLALTTAARRGAVAVLTDRGLLDGAAYYPGGLPSWFPIAQMTREDLCRRYAHVFFLPSLATTHPTQYSSSSNAHRRESLEEARKANDLTYDVWQAHPHLKSIHGDTLDERYRSLLAHLTQAVPALGPLSQRS